MNIKIKQNYPLILAVLMYVAATYLIIFVFVSYDAKLSIYPNWTTLLSVLGNVANYLYLSGSILLIGFFISGRLRNK
ncbi:MAG: hypothetical protein KGD65_15545 [Candidatus Lokiarchaeota archaeon]|nr:hypothetical protein [Candidatus Lokiarchaeota archaeon]